MPHVRNNVDIGEFNTDLQLPYALRVLDFQAAMQDVYDLFYDISSCP